MNKLILGLPVLLVLGVAGCRMMDSSSTADNDHNLNSKDNLTGVFSNLVVDYSSENNKVKPEKQNSLADRAVHLASATNIPENLEDKASNYGSPLGNIELEGGANGNKVNFELEEASGEGRSLTYTIKLGGRHIGSPKRILESQDSSSDQRIEPGYAKKKPVLAGRNKSNLKIHRHVEPEYVAKKDTIPAATPAPLAESSAPATSIAPLAESSAPIIDPAPQVKSKAPKTDPAPLTKGSIILIDHNRWVIGG